MKTNHRRNFKERYRQYGHSPMGGTSKKSTFSDRSVGAGWGGDNTDGHQGWAKAKRGAKKFVRSRIRAADKMKLRTIDEEE